MEAIVKIAIKWHLLTQGPTHWCPADVLPGHSAPASITALIETWSNELHSRLDNSDIKAAPDLMRCPGEYKIDVNQRKNTLGAGIIQLAKSDVVDGCQLIQPHDSTAVFQDSVSQAQWFQLYQWPYFHNNVRIDDVHWWLHNVQFHSQLLSK